MGHDELRITAKAIQEIWGREDSKYGRKSPNISVGALISSGNDMPEFYYNKDHPDYPPTAQKIVKWATKQVEDKIFPHLSKSDKARLRSMNSGMLNVCPPEISERAKIWDNTPPEKRKGEDPRPFLLGKRKTP